MNKKIDALSYGTKESRQNCVHCLMNLKMKTFCVEILLFLKGKKLLSGLDRR